MHANSNESAESGVIEEDLRSYGSVSGWAVASALCGVLSAVALFSDVLLIVPAIGAFMAILALRRISDPAYAVIGRTPALVGLVLSIVFAVAVPVERVAERWLILRDSDQFARLWFALLSENRPIEALRLEIDPFERFAYKGKQQIVDYYRRRDNGGDEVKYFFQDPLIKTLIALKDRAEVRFYENEVYAPSKTRSVVVNVYAVTYVQNGRRHTFFVRIGLERVKALFTPDIGWQMMTHQGGIRPKSLGGAPDNATRQ